MEEMTRPPLKYANFTPEQRAEIEEKLRIIEDSDLTNQEKIKKLKAERKRKDVKFSEKARAILRPWINEGLIGTISSSDERYMKTIPMLNKRISLALKAAYEDGQKSARDKTSSIGAN